MCIGDFIEIIKVEERSGGAIWPERQMQEFRDYLDYCGLKDLVFLAYLSHGVMEDSMVLWCGCNWTRLLLQ